MGSPHLFWGMLGLAGVAGPVRLHRRAGNHTPRGAHKEQHSEQDRHR